MFATAQSPERDEMPKLRVRGLHKSFGERKILRGIDLDVSRGEVIGVLGPNGCGKSTLLRCINWLENFQAGEVALDGEVFGQGRPDDAAISADDAQRARQLRQRVGMVFQRFNLFPHMSVLKNVMSGPLHVQGKSRDEAHAIAVKMLGMVGLADKAKLNPATLSGGQQQRVAIARSLAMNPDVMLFDEATSALDPVTAREVLGTMRDLAQAGITMLVVTHHLKFCRDVADRIVFLNAGLVEAEGTPAEVLDEAPTQTIRDFLDAE